MKKKHRILLIGALGVALLALVYGKFVAPYLDMISVPVLQPEGIIAQKQYRLLIDATLLMLLVVVPVLAMTVFIALYYRKGGRAKYEPNWDNSHVAEILWWGFPFAIIVLLSILTWKSCHELDPYKPIASQEDTLEVQVVALRWKWLFIYPKYQVACVNYLQIPEKRPIQFDITADAPMNAFWIPQLGGMIYAMPGMRTKLYLKAEKPGSYRGSSAHLSGPGFAGMVFETKATTNQEFIQWIENVAQTAPSFTQSDYQKLAEPSMDEPVAVYRLQDANLFDSIVMKFMPKSGQNNQEQACLED